MKINYSKKDKTMTVTMDNGVDTIKVIGGENFFDKLRMVGSRNLPTNKESIHGLALLYYDRRTKSEKPRKTAPSPHS